MDILQKNIIKELGLENLPEDKREEVYLRISKIIYQNIIIRVVEILSEEEQDEFNKLLDEVAQEEGESDKVLEFLMAKINNFDDIVAEEIVRFKEESEGVMQELKKEE
ncbi:MAG TPA: hypothetical protein ENI66_01135 [Candidatus Yonathbacteria bacterium]|nr:hypothetical protein [Candidatus Yonathbacteria bacterium]